MTNTKKVKARLAACGLALAIAAGAAAPVQAAEGRNAAAIAGAVGGFAAGALLGSALQPQQPYAAPAYPVAPAYRPAPVVRERVIERRVIVEEEPEECFVRTERVYVDGYPRKRRVTVCH